MWSFFLHFHLGWTEAVSSAYHRRDQKVRLPSTWIANRQITAAGNVYSSSLESRKEPAVLKNIQSHVDWGDWVWESQLFKVLKDTKKVSDDSSNSMTGVNITAHRTVDEVAMSARLVLHWCITFTVQKTLERWRWHLRQFHKLSEPPPTLLLASGTPGKFWTHWETKKNYQFLIDRGLNRFKPCLWQLGCDKEAVGPDTPPGLHSDPEKLVFSPICTALWKFSSQS